MDPATAAKVTKDTVEGISTLVEFLETVKDRNINSITEYAKQTLISSRLYIEDSISAEPIIKDLAQALSQIYCSFILCTFNLNELIQGGRTVRQLMAPVSTENFESILDVIKNEFGDKNVSVLEVGSLEDNHAQGGSTVGNINNKEIKIETDPSKLFVGRLLEVTVGRGQDKASLYFLVQLNPYIVPGAVMEEYLRLNTDPSKALRKAQWKAGEIKYWRDYIFELDRVAKRKKALKLDKDGILREMEDHKSGGILKSILNFLKPAGLQNRNVANTITIVSKNKLDAVCRELGLNMKNFNDRQRIMSGTYNVMLVAYDPNYETVDLYMNGIANRGEYNAQSIKAFAKKDEDMDMKQLLALLSAGSAPKF